MLLFAYILILPPVSLSLSVHVSISFVVEVWHPPGLSTCISFYTLVLQFIQIRLSGTAVKTSVWLKFNPTLHKGQIEFHLFLHTRNHREVSIRKHRLHYVIFTLLSGCNYFHSAYTWRKKEQVHFVEFLWSLIYYVYLWKHRPDSVLYIFFNISMLHVFKETHWLISIYFIKPLLILVLRIFNETTTFCTFHGIIVIFLYCTFKQT